MIFTCGISYPERTEDDDGNGDNGGPGANSSADKDDIDPARAKEEEQRRRKEFLKEPYEWGQFVNINAVVIMCVVFFIMGFYA